MNDLPLQSFTCIMSFKWISAIEVKECCQKSPKISQHALRGVCIVVFNSVAAAVCPVKPEIIRISSRNRWMAMIQSRSCVLWNHKEKLNQCHAVSLVTRYTSLPIVFDCLFEQPMHMLLFSSSHGPEMAGFGTACTCSNAMHNTLAERVTQGDYARYASSEANSRWWTSPL